MMPMRSGTVLVLVGVAVVAAYSVGRQNVPDAPVSVTSSPSVLAKPVAFIALANSFATCGRHSQEATGFASGAEANRA